MTLAIYEELRPAPWEFGCEFPFAVVEGTVGAQVCVNWMCVLSVRLNFLEDGELSPKLASGQLQDLIWFSLLLAKGVDREGHDLQTLILHVLMHLN